MSTKPNIPEEEVDLGTLFSQIGKMFSNFFNFIGNIFKSIYHYLIIFLLFIRKNILILAGATLIGVIVGFLMDINKEPIYQSEISVKTNYGSASLLYKQIDLLNSLINSKDTVKIANILKINQSQAGQLNGFSIESIDKEKNTLLDYDKYMQETDTIYTRGFKYEDFLLRNNTTDLKHHKINVYTRNSIELDIDEGIKDLVKSEYYINLKDSIVKERRLEKRVLLNNLSQIDSLRKRYREVAFTMAEKTTKSEANLKLTSNSSPERNIDVDLFNLSYSALLKLDEINKKIIDNEEIISITSGYKTGQKGGSFSSQKKVRYGLYGFILSFLVLTGLQFNKYLNRYEKNVRSQS